jgi:hypothetical protein
VDHQEAAAPWRLFTGEAARWLHRVFLYVVFSYIGVIVPGTHRGSLRAAVMSRRRCLTTRIQLPASATMWAFSKGWPATQTRQTGVPSLEDGLGAIGSARGGLRRCSSELWRCLGFGPRFDGKSGRDDSFYRGFSPYYSWWVQTQVLHDFLFDLKSIPLRIREREWFL